MRARCEAAFAAAVAACDPAARVRDALGRAPIAGARVFGLAVGKAALAMARGAGPVARGLVVAIEDDGRGLPEGWQLMIGAHPVPDERSVAAGAAAVALVESAGPGDAVLALISGGASALIEQPLVPLAEFRARTGGLAASGMQIAELNAERTALSAIKGGKLAARCAAPIATLAMSDVIGDDPAVIGSGPTVRAGDWALVIAPLRAFAEAVQIALGSGVRLIAEPLTGDVAHVARRLAGETGAVVAYGEPTLALPPEHGQGGRAQQLALLLARELRGTARFAFVAGSDGVDGPPPDGRPAPAGAYVDGTTWDTLVDPEAALARCDAGPTLARAGALFIPGPTGINHADLVVLG